MESQVTEAIASSAYSNLFDVFQSAQYFSTGTADKHSLHVHVLEQCMNHPDFLSKPFSGAIPQEQQQMVVDICHRCLRELPSYELRNAIDNKIRRQLFDYFVRVRQEFESAAKVLSNIRMEDTDPSSPYYFSPADKCDIYVQMAECFLQDGEFVGADSAVGKASAILASNSNNSTGSKNAFPRALVLRYKSTYTRVLDSTRKFQQAATQYYELSQAFEDGVPADELLIFLGRAATCAILSPSGPHRQSLLGLITNDERLHKLDSLQDFHAHSGVLTKMSLCQMLNPKEINNFQKTLEPHQKVKNADGLTLLEKCVFEHTMIAASKLYDSIYFSELAHLLAGLENEESASSTNADVHSIERMAAKMIMNGQLNGTIDEVDGILDFDNDNSNSHEGISHNDDEIILAWDEEITNMCRELNRVVDLIREQ